MTLTKARIDNLLQFNSEGSDCQANAEQWEVYELACMALVSLEAEPVGEFYHEARWGWYEISEGDSVPERARIPLYRVPPAPVFVPISFEEWSRKCDLQIQLCDPQFREKAQYIWNSACAAMLKTNK